MTVADLLDIYAEQHEENRNEVQDRYDDGQINSQDLLQAYLEYEGIFGYEHALMCVFKALKAIGE